MTEKDSLVVQDIEHFAQVAADIVAGGKLSFLSETSQGEIFRYAAHTVIVNIAAAAERVSEDFVVAYPDIPWREIRGMRNRLAHDYDGINEDLVWVTLTRDIPAIVSVLRNGEVIG